MEVKEQLEHAIFALELKRWPLTDLKSDAKNGSFKNTQSHMTWSLVTRAFSSHQATTGKGQEHVLRNLTDST